MATKPPTRDHWGVSPRLRKAFFLPPEWSKKLSNILHPGPYILLLSNLWTGTPTIHFISQDVASKAQGYHQFSFQWISFCIIFPHVWLEIKPYLQRAMSVFPCFPEWFVPFSSMFFMPRYHQTFQPISPARGPPRCPAPLETVAWWRRTTPFRGGVWG